MPIMLIESATRLLLELIVLYMGEVRRRSSETFESNAKYLRMRGYRKTTSKKGNAREALSSVTLIADTFLKTHEKYLKKKCPEIYLHSSSTAKPQWKSIIYPDNYLKTLVCSLQS
ncbi:hypothetical protein NPIL_21381 [Nephila pilipes]|uniref:Uncharacterized protein n=1 Tax=Nephila pilipes TaxID=299642 RepID=A0A8X6UAM8_NEPPI|nr:hypothetical protein NPIL_21381 [Nephila pilipes]